MKTYVRPSAALLRQSVTAPQGLKTSVLKSHPPAASPMPAAKNSAKTFVSPNAAGLPQSRQRPARHQKHLFPRSPHAPATPATTSTPKNICSPSRPATSTYANNPGTTPSQMLKTYVLTIGRDAAPCRHFPEIGHVSPAQNRAASTQSSQYSASSSRQPGSPGSTPRPQAAQKKNGSGVFSSRQPTR